MYIALDVFFYFILRLVDGKPIGMGYIDSSEKYGVTRNAFGFINEFASGILLNVCVTYKSNPGDRNVDNISFSI